VKRTEATMGLFRRRRKIIKAGGLWPPADVPLSHMLKICLEGLDDPSGDFSEWSSTEPQWKYSTWAVFPSDGSDRYEVDSSTVLNVLYRDCSSVQEFEEITGVLKTEFERAFGRNY